MQQLAANGGLSLLCLPKGKAFTWFVIAELECGLHKQQPDNKHHAKNSEGNTARNLAILSGYHEIAEQLLIREIDNYISAWRTWHEMSTGRSWMSPSRNAWQTVIDSGEA